MSEIIVVDVDGGNYSVHTNVQLGQIRKEAVVITIGDVQTNDLTQKMRCFALPYVCDAFFVRILVDMLIYLNTMKATHGQLVVVSAALMPHQYHVSRCVAVMCFVMTKVEKEMACRILWFLLSSLTMCTMEEAILQLHATKDVVRQLVPNTAVTGYITAQ